MPSNDPITNSCGSSKSGGTNRQRRTNKHRRIPASQNKAEVVQVWQLDGGHKHPSAHNNTPTPKKHCTTQKNQGCTVHTSTPRGTSGPCGLRLDWYRTPPPPRYTAPHPTTQPTDALRLCVCGVLPRFCLGLVVLGVGLVAGRGVGFRWNCAWACVLCCRPAHGLT